MSITQSSRSLRRFDEAKEGEVDFRVVIQFEAPLATRTLLN